MRVPMARRFMTLRRCPKKGSATHQNRLFRKIASFHDGEITPVSTRRV